ncbi:MAG: hypothetical protein A3J74_01875 [Elusimicrobia bacterium RIFCSPHIGHO2_02_FULL_57_9]|nr:MAG: hypothetical protein A3J74_01875 [Elusimicrobia bacterium RIFCSPHIGHO2_02_FULL_57_9]
MADKEVRWLSFPFIAPKGKGSKPEQPKGEIFEVDPPAELLARRSWYDDPINLTPQERRKRIVALLAIALRRWVTEQQKKG